MHASPELLDTAAFHDRVHALAPRIAVFDCDGTLWSGDAGSTFMRWTMETGFLSPAASSALNAATRPTSAAKCRSSPYAAKWCSATPACPNRRSVKQPPRSSVNRLNGTSSPKCCSSSQPFKATAQKSGLSAPPAIGSSRKASSASTSRRPRVLAASVLAEGGVATATLRDVPTDEGKVAALCNAGIHAPDVVFGNSVHDAAMLAIARGPFPVNPSPALVARAAAEGWPVYWPASVAPSK